MPHWRVSPKTAHTDLYFIIGATSPRAKEKRPPKADILEVRNATGAARG
jgi:hypothetical protein